MAAPGIAPAKEESFYTDAEGVRVTNTRLIIGQTTFAMSNITSVSCGAIRPKRLGPMLFMGLGGVCLLATFSGAGNATPMGVFLILCGVAWWALQKTKYCLCVASSSGEVKPINSKDKQRIEKIVQAVNESMIARG